MRLKFVLPCFALAGALITPLNVEAQDRGPRLRVIPSVSSYQPLGKLAYSRGGPGEPESAPEWLQMGAGYAVGLAVEAPVPGLHFLGIRGGVKHAFGSRLATGSYVGTTACGEHCAEARYERAEVSDASLTVASTDLTLRPAPVSWLAQPYLLTGIGWRSRNLDYGSIPDGSVVDEARERSSQWIPHFGVGIEVPVRSATVALETDIYGALQRNDVAIQGGSSGDAFLSLGVRIGL